MDAIEPGAAPAHERLRYDPAAVESRWRRRWAEDNSYEVDTSMGRREPDALRLAAMRAKRAEDLDGQTAQIGGCERFLHRVWRLAATAPDDIPRIRNHQPTPAARRHDHTISCATHHLIHQIGDHYRRKANNRAVAGFMTFTNNLYAYVQSDLGPHRDTLAEAVDALLLVMAPAAPHITAELWARRHHGEHIHVQRWPTADPAKLAQTSVTMVIQVDGKVRHRVAVAPDIDEDGAIHAARSSDRVVSLLAGHEPRRIIARPPKLVNLVR